MTRQASSFASPIVTAALLTPIARASSALLLTAPVSSSNVPAPAATPATAPVRAGHAAAARPPAWPSSVAQPLRPPP